MKKSASFASVKPALYQNIVRDVQTRIESGELAPGARLPSINALCFQHKVSTITVRTALRELGAKGLVASQARRGVFVCEKSLDKVKSAGLLQNAIAVLSLLPLEENAELSTSNWARAIGQGAYQAIEKAGFHAFSLHPNRFSETDIAHLAVAKPLGVVFTELHTQRQRAMHIAEALTACGVPLVVYGGAPELAAYDRVLSDHEAGSYALTRYLIQKGCKRLLNVWTESETGYWFTRRRTGYERALREAHIEPLPDLIVPPFIAPHGKREEFENSVRRLASFFIEPFSDSSPVDGLLMATDVDAIAAAAACRLFGKKPNHDVLIAGYDNFWQACGERQFEPCAPLVTIDKCDAATGQSLVQLLLDRVAARLPHEPQSRLTLPQLIEVENS